MAFTHYTIYSGKECWTENETSPQLAGRNSRSSDSHLAHQSLGSLPKMRESAQMISQLCFRSVVLGRGAQQAPHRRQSEIRPPLLIRRSLCYPNGGVCISRILAIVSAFSLTKKKEVWGSLLWKGEFLKSKDRTGRNAEHSPIPIVFLEHGESLQWVSKLWKERKEEYVAQMWAWPSPAPPCVDPRGGTAPQPKSSPYTDTPSVLALKSRVGRRPNKVVALFDTGRRNFTA